MRRVIFLDIDGVLNSFRHFHDKECPKIDYQNSKVFNLILYLTKRPEVVIISTWGLYCKDPQIFQWMLFSHGIDCHVSEVISKEYQHDKEPESRSNNVNEYIKKHDLKEFCVIDDLDLNVPNHVQPNPKYGLLPKHVKEVCKHFK